MSKMIILDYPPSPLSKPRQQSLLKDETYNFPFIYSLVKKEIKNYKLILTTEDLKKLNFEKMCLPLQTSFLLKTTPDARSYIFEVTGQKRFKVSAPRVFKKILDQWYEVCNNFTDPGDRGMRQIDFMNHVKYFLAHNGYHPMCMDILLEFVNKTKYSIFDMFFRHYTQGVILNNSTAIDRNNTVADLYKACGSTEAFWAHIQKYLEIEDWTATIEKKPAEATRFSGTDEPVVSFTTQGFKGTLTLEKGLIPRGYSFGKADPIHHKRGLAPIATQYILDALEKKRSHQGYMGRNASFTAAHSNFFWISKIVREILSDRRSNKENFLIKVRDELVGIKDFLKTSGAMAKKLHDKFPLIEFKDQMIKFNPLALPTEWLEEAYVLYSAKLEELKKEPKGNFMSWRGDLLRVYTYHGKDYDIEAITLALRSRIIKETSGKTKLKGVFK